MAGLISNSYATGDVSAPTTQGVGGLVGWMNSGTVTNSYATGNVTSPSSSISASIAVGGLVGGMQGGTVRDSYATGAVSGGESVGGLVGYMYGGPLPGTSSPSFPATISNSHATGAVTGTFAVGGLVGSSYGIQANSTINNSYATGTVTGVTSAAQGTSTQVGGLVGHNYGGTGGGGNYGGVATVSNSYATGNVTGTSNVGGLVGSNYGLLAGGTVLNSYSTGRVNNGAPGAGIGGLIGNNTSGAAGNAPGTVTNSYWNLETSEQFGSDGGNPLNSAEMSAQVFFTSWDFSNTWVMGTTPLLIADMTAATVTANAATKTYDGVAFSGGNGVTITQTINGLTSTVSPSLTGLTYGGSSHGAVDAGNYVITPGGLTSDQQGYYFTYASGALTVIPLTLTGSVSTGTSTYGSALTPGTVTFSNAVAGNIPTPTVFLNITGNTSTSGHVNAGSYTGVEFVAAISGGTNLSDYTLGTITGNYTVTPLALTGSIAAGSSVYGATLAPGAATFTNVLAGDVVTAGSVAVNTTGNTSTSGNLKAGSYTGVESVTGLTGADSGNYSFAAPTGDYTVSKLALTGSIATGSSVYGSALAPGAVTFTNVVAGDVVSAGSVAVNTTGNTSTSNHLNAGTYTGVESVTGLSGADSGNYSFAAPTGDYTVSPLALTASIAAGSSVYGSALAPGAVTFSNAIANDVVSAGTATVNTTGNTSTSGHLNAGGYTGIESVGTPLTGADAGNYTFAGATGNYTVSQLALTGSIAAGSSVYGSTLVPGAATFTNIVPGDDVSASTEAVNTAGNTSTSTHLNAGTYTGVESVTGLSGADSGNYTFAGVTGNYTVSQLALAGSIAAGSSVYGSTLVPGAATFTNVLTGDVVTAGSVSVNIIGNTSTSGNIRAGSYPGVQSVTGLTGADSGNYSLTALTGNYTVTPLALTASIAAGSSVYGAALAPGAVTFNNAVAGDAFSTDLVSVNTTGNTSTSGNLKVGSYNGIESLDSALRGPDASNYTFAGATGGNYTVTPMVLTADR